MTPMVEKLARRHVANCAGASLGTAFCSTSLATALLLLNGLERGAVVAALDQKAVDAAMMIHDAMLENGAVFRPRVARAFRALDASTKPRTWRRLWISLRLWWASKTQDQIVTPIEPGRVNDEAAKGN